MKLRDSLCEGSLLLGLQRERVFDAVERHNVLGLVPQMFDFVLLVLVGAEMLLWSVNYV